MKIFKENFADDKLPCSDGQLEADFVAAAKLSIDYYLTEAIGD
jgi:hypothetical protein